MQALMSNEHMAVYCFVYGRLSFCRFPRFLEASHLKAAPESYTYMRNAKRTRQRSVAARLSLKRLPPEEATLPMPQASQGRQQFGQAALKKPTKLPVSPSDMTKGDAREQKEVSLGITMMFSAEALHKERIALESIVEPCQCSVDLRYVRSLLWAYR